MNEELTTIPKEITPPSTPDVGAPKPDAKTLRVEQVGRLLGAAYEKASQLKLKDGESRKLREDFADLSVEIRSHDGIIYISHMALRERLWDVFGPGAVAEICRDRFMRTDSNEIAVDLVLLIRGVFVAEAIGTAKYHPNNPNMGYGDCVEAAWSDALRRCCKKFGVGTQVWRPGYIRDWKTRNATEFHGKWRRKENGTRPEKLVMERVPKAPEAAQEQNNGPF